MKDPKEMSPRELVTELLLMESRLVKEDIETDGLAPAAATTITQLLDARDRIIVERDQARRNVRALSIERDELESTLRVLRKQHLELLRTYKHNGTTTLSDRMDYAYEVELIPGETAEAIVQQVDVVNIKQSNFERVQGIGGEKIPPALQEGVSKLVREERTKYETLDIQSPTVHTLGEEPDDDQPIPEDDEGDHPDNIKNFTPKTFESKFGTPEEFPDPNQPKVRDGGVVDGGPGKAPGPQNPPKPDRITEIA